MQSGQSSGMQRREFLVRTGFPSSFRAAYKRWHNHLPPMDQRSSQTIMANKLRISDPKTIRNWMDGISAPAKEGDWIAVRTVLAEAVENAEHLAALDAAFARARGNGRLVLLAPDGASALREVKADAASCVWKAGRYLPAIRNLVEFRIRLMLNDPASTGPCPVHVWLILGQSEREAAGRRVQIAFEELELFFDSQGHEVRTETIFGIDGTLPPGVSTVPGGWLLKPSSGEEGLLLSDPTRGACLFVLDGKGATVSPTLLELEAKAGKVDVRDADRPKRRKTDKKRAILDAIFRRPHDPEGMGRYLVGRGEVWQEDQA